MPPPFSIDVNHLRQASQNLSLVATMREFYEQTDAAISREQATCWNKGECCRFGQFGHRLYVTAIEAAYYLAGHPTPPPITEDTCPHAHGGQCHAREHRPLGCRIFYCDPNAQNWQGPLTEERLGRLREMHESFGLDYFYADWMEVLNAIHTAESGPSSIR